MESSSEMPVAAVGQASTKEQPTSAVPRRLTAIILATNDVPSADHPALQSVTPRLDNPATDPVGNKKRLASLDLGNINKRILSSAGYLRGDTEYVEEVITLSGFARRAIWFMVLVLILSNIALLTTFAIIYLQNETYDSFLWLFRTYFLFSKGIQFLTDHSQQIGVSYAILSAVFSAIALRFLWTALPKRQRHVGDRSVRATRVISVRTPGSINASFKRTHSKVKSNSIVKWVVKLHAAWDANFGVRGPLFDLRWLCEETVEIAGQSIVAYSASQNISNDALNLTYAVVIFLNCMASFVIRLVFKASLIKQRFACILVDIVIDFAWGSVIPLWMYRPLLKIYVDRVHIMDYIDNSTNSTREVERVLILKWLYFLFSIAPFCNAVTSFTEIQHILEVLTPSTKKTLAVDASKESPTDGTTELQLRYPVGRRKNGPIVRLLHVLTPLYGIAVLLNSLMANGVLIAEVRHNEFRCINRVHPWFATKEACLGREIHCSSVGISGNVSELERVFAYLDENSLSDLYLTNCTGLVIPRKIQSFPHLMSLSITDSRLVEWGEAASVTDDAFDDLRTIKLSGVDVAQDPVGLIGVKQLARCFEWIYLENMNATTMLSHVGDHWRSLFFFTCINCGLTSVPEPLLEMPLQLLVSLASNNISTITDEWGARLPPRLQVLWMDNNPLLTEVPDSMWRQAATLVDFSLVGTNLSFVPAWVADVANPLFKISATDTPLCTGALAAPARVQQFISCL